MADSFVKDPDAILDFHFDWTDWLVNGDTILTSQIIASAGITVGDGVLAPVPSFTTTNTTYWLAGGTAGKPYTITNRITTSQGRTDDRTMTIRIQDR